MAAIREQWHHQTCLNMGNNTLNSYVQKEELEEPMSGMPDMTPTSLAARLVQAKSLKMIRVFERGEILLQNGIHTLHLTQANRQTKNGLF